MKKRCWYPVANIKNRSLFGSYEEDFYIESRVVVNRPRAVQRGDHVRIKRNPASTSIRGQGIERNSSFDRRGRHHLGELFYQCL